jgi:hypothetical protein
MVYYRSLSVDRQQQGHQLDFPFGVDRLVRYGTSPFSAFRCRGQKKIIAKLPATLDSSRAGLVVIAALCAWWSRGADTSAASPHIK